MRETQVKRTPDPAVEDRKIARAHSANEVDKAIFDVVRTCRCERARQVMQGLATAVGLRVRSIDGHLA
jgi:hypothetical protein